MHEFLNGKHAAFNSHRYQSNPGLFTNVRARVESLTENWVKFHFSELEKCIFWEPTLLKEVFLREKYRELNRKRYRKMQEENSHNALCTIILWAAESIDPESVAGMPLLGINSLSPLFFFISWEISPERIQCPDKTKRSPKTWCTEQKTINVRRLRRLMGPIKFCNRNSRFDLFDWNRFKIK